MKLEGAPKSIMIFKYFLIFRLLEINKKFLERKKYL